MSFFEIIDHFSSGDTVAGQYTVTRYAAQAYDANGRLVARGAPTTVVITAGIQPVTGRELEMLQENGVTSEVRKAFTETPLQTRRPGQEPDEITIGGETYVAYSASVWEGFDEVVYVTLIARKDQS